jgi:Secretory lipase
VRPLLGIVLVAAIAAACGSDRASPTTPATLAPTAPPTGPSASPTPAPTPETAVPTPAGDVYSVPDPLPDGRAGDLIWAERVAAPRGAVAWRVLYRSETIEGEPIGVSGLIVAPDEPPPPDSWPVIGYAHGTTGLADRCAPSKATAPLADGDTVGDLPLPPLWERGFVIAATDYEGLGTPGRHPYLVGGSEGRSVLDAIRAAQRLPDTHAGDEVVVVGVSQGGHAALFAGELAAGYAPEIDVRGVVALAPGSELARAALLLSNDPTAVGFAVAIGAGLEAAYPEARLEDILTPTARRSIDVVDERCIERVLDAFALPAGEVLRLDRILAPPWPRLLDENTPGREESGAPVFVGQGTADALVVPELTDLLVERLCRTGDTVTYRRYAGVSHAGIADAAADDVHAWVRDRLDGVPAPTGCDR